MKKASSKIKINLDLGGFSRANLFSILGLLLFAVLSWFSFMCKESGTANLGLNILYSILLTAFTWILLIALVVLKKKNSGDFKYARTVEMIFFTLYVFFAITTYLFLHQAGYSITFNKEKVQNACKEDVNKIEVLISSYDHFVNDTINLVEGSLMNVVNNPNCWDNSVSDFMSNKLANKNTTNKDIQDTYIKNIRNVMKHKNYNERIEKLRFRYKNYNYATIYSIGIDIKNFEEEVYTELIQKAQIVKGKLPRIDRNANNQYTIKYQYTWEKREPEMTAFQIMRGENIGLSSCIITGLVTALIHLLILFSYIFGKRNSRTEMIPGSMKIGTPITNYKSTNTYETV